MPRVPPVTNATRPRSLSPTTAAAAAVSGVGVSTVVMAPPAEREWAVTPSLPTRRPIPRVSAPGGSTDLGERVGDPVRDEGAHEGQVVQTDVLGGALLRGEHPQLALRRVDRLLVGAVRVLQGDLAGARAVRHEERHGDPLDDAVEVHAVGELDEPVEVVEAPHPEHLLPV